MEQYLLQPVKSVVMKFPGGKRSRDVPTNNQKWTIYGKEMPVVTETMHMGSKKISNDQELIQSDHISCPQNQKGTN